MSRMVYMDEEFQQLFPYQDINKNEAPNMTNGDYIRTMSNDEIAKFITDDLCEVICGNPAASVCDGQCETRMLEWLERDVDEERGGKNERFPD